MTLEEGKALFLECTAELKKRFIVGPENYRVKLVDKVNF
jgi:hypothetical protein